ncbi:hypothetical protein DFS33DRAFT_1387293 [Desarmillaria ectypa]|nr:hypothetical protein DFS33DRAFT_1387293 [Desarmillaria ectypa]
MVAVATALRPFPCKKCNQSFTKGSDLKRHAPKHWSKKRREDAKYPCEFPGCKHKSLQLSNLKTHMYKKHFNIQNKKCPDCVFKTADASELTRHKINKHLYVPKRRLPRQRTIPSADSMIDDDSGDEDKDEKGNIVMDSLNFPRRPPFIASSSCTGSSMAVDTPPASSHNADVDSDIDMPVAISPLPPPSPVSMCYTPPPTTIAPVCFSSPPLNVDSDMPSPAPSSYCRSITYIPQPTNRDQTGDIHLPSPPRSTSPRLSPNLLLGLPAELFIMGPRDCQLPRIM